ncbi:hypothetical protein PSELUDRAFT_0541 [Vogesella sp. LIG4]|nr:hypothetical protein PSELUDRAFT_0541 [Vogesella sp. LIG4]
MPGRSIFKDYAQRARAISATYARFYLELEEHGLPKKKGRYYWMALGAFASKTVACTLDLIRVDAGKYLPVVHPDFDDGYVRDGLGKGNFWLFQDIAPTHWYHNYSPDTFEQCLDTRGENGCHQAVIDNLKRLPWADTALPTLKYLPISGFIKSAFATIKDIETAETPADRAKAQLSHLIAIAKHEQGVILQPLMYDDPKFAKWVQRQRGWLSWASPNLELVFTHACETDDPKLKSVAPKDTILENFDSRMIWITSAANDFHRLMQTQTSTMEKELKIMAGWYVSKD